MSSRLAGAGRVGSSSSPTLRTRPAAIRAWGFGFLQHTLSRAVRARIPAHLPGVASLASPTGRTFIAALAVVASGVFSQGEAQAPCQPYLAAKEMLANKHGEHRVISGLSRNGQVLIEVYANRDTGSWTVVRTFAGSGMACLMSAGDNFQTFEIKEGEDL